MDRDKNKYLENFYNLIYEDKIEYSIELRKNFIKKSRVEKIVSEIFLEDANLTLLIFDRPINILCSYCIFISDSCKLFKFKIKNRKEIFVSTQSIINLIKDKVDNFSIEEFNLIKLNSIRYEKKFECVFFDDYQIKDSKINLEKINLVKGDFEIKTFCPDINPYDFYISKKQNIKILSLIDYNTIKKTNINVFDTSSQKNLLSPITSKFCDKDIFVNEKGIEILNIFQKKYFLKFDKNNIATKIKNTNFSNNQKSNLLKQLNGINKIRIDSTYSNFPIPVFRDLSSDKFKLINGEKGFREFSEVNLYLKTNFLKSIVFRNKNIVYDCLCLKKNFIDIFFGNQKEIKSISDLIVYLELYENYEKLYLLEDENKIKNKMNFMIRNLNKIYDKFIKILIDKNEAFENKDLNFLDKFLSNLCFKIDKNFKDFLKHKSKKVLLDNHLKILNDFLKIKNQIEISKSLFYFYCFFMLNAKILNEIYNNDFSKKVMGILSVKKDNFKNFEKEYFDVLLYYFYLKSKNSLIVLKKKNILNLKISQKPKVKRKVLVPRKKFFETFKFIYKKILLEVKKTNDIDFEFLEIKIDKKIIKVPKDFFNIKNIYESKKTIFETENYELLL